MFKRRNLTPTEVAKRLAGPPWQIYFEHQGERCGPWSLKFADVPSAVAEAKVMLDRYFDGKREDFRAVLKRPDHSKVSTFSDVFSSIHSLPMDANSTTRVRYIWGTRYLLQLALGLPEREAVDSQPLTVLNAETGRILFANVKKLMSDLDSQAEQNRFRVNVSTAWGCIKSLFSPAVVDYMRKDLHLTLPCTVEDFRKAAAVARFKAPSGSEFEAPNNALLRRIFREWIKLGRTPGYSVPGAACNHTKEVAPLPEVLRRNMFISIGLMFSFALRAGEVPQIRGRHLSRDMAGVIRLDTGIGEVAVKNKSARITVRPLDPFFSLMRRVMDSNSWTVGADDYLLSDGVAKHDGWSGISYRNYWPFILISNWLRSFRWNLQKTNHALRDCAASFVTMKFGIDRAKKFCRHKSVITTEKHYNRFVIDETMDKKNVLPWLKWAK